MKLAAFIGLSTLFLSACSAHYSDLEHVYGVDELAPGPDLPVDQFTLFSRGKAGAESYNGGVTFRATADSIELDVLFHRPVRIPSADVAACTMTCYGSDDRHVNLLVPRTGTDIEVKSSDVLEWCWARHKPMLSGAAERAWAYESAPLPPLETFKEQLASRVLYDKQIHQSCMGY